MKSLIAILLIAVAVGATAEPKGKTNPSTKATNLDLQNKAIDKGLEESRQKADSAIPPSPKPPVSATQNEKTLQQKKGEGTPPKLSGSSFGFGAQTTMTATSSQRTSASKAGPTKDTIRKLMEIDSESKKSATLPAKQNSSSSTQPGGAGQSSMTSSQSMSATGGGTGGGGVGGTAGVKGAGGVKSKGGLR